MEFYHAEDLEEVPGLPTAQYLEELLGLPLAVYPREMEEPQEMEVHPGGIVGNSPGTPDWLCFYNLGQQVLVGSLLTQLRSPLPLSEFWTGTRWSGVGQGPPIPCCQPHPWSGSLST